MRTLIVDDSRALRKILARAMAALGFEVVEAGTGREALARFHDTPDLDVALVDWNLPGMDGPELVPAVRRERRFDDVRLVMVSTESAQERMQRALEAGADESVMTPFTPEILVTKLALAGVDVEV